MCFNAPKNWQFGWYEDTHVTIENNWSGNIYGIADCYDSPTASNVIIQIPKTSSASDLLQSDEGYK